MRPGSLAAPGGQPSGGPWGALGGSHTRSTSRDGLGKVPECTDSIRPLARHWTPDDGTPGNLPEGSGGALISSVIHWRRQRFGPAASAFRPALRRHVHVLLQPSPARPSLPVPAERVRPHVSLCWSRRKPSIGEFFLAWHRRRLNTRPRPHRIAHRFPPTRQPTSPSSFLPILPPSHPSPASCPATSPIPAYIWLQLLYSSCLLLFLHRVLASRSTVTYGPSPPPAIGSPRSSSQALPSLRPVAARPHSEAPTGSEPSRSYSRHQTTQAKLPRASDFTADAKRNRHYACAAATFSPPRESWGARSQPTAGLNQVLCIVRHVQPSAAPRSRTA